MAACLQYRISIPVHHFTKTSRVWCNPRTIKTRHNSQIPTRFSSIQMNQSTESTVGATEQIVGKSDDGGDVLYQYVVLRRDLIDTWPLGCVVTQGCHASVSAIWMNKDDSHTVEYCSPSKIDSMHKVTLEVKGETQILNLSEKLKAGGISHKLWIEEPENMPTCLATKPYPKSMLILSRNKDSTFGEKGVAFSHIYILFQNTILHNFKALADLVQWEHVYHEIEKTQLGVPVSRKANNDHLIRTLRSYVNTCQICLHRFDVEFNVDIHDIDVSSVRQNLLMKVPSCQ